MSSPGQPPRTPSTPRSATSVGDKLGGDLAGMHNDDLVAIHTYLFGVHAQIDGALRGSDLAALAPWDAQIRVMMHALKQLPAFAGVVYRGATLSPDALAGYVRGLVLREPGFAAASADPARVFAGNVQYVIHSVHGRRVQALSPLPDEQVVLFFAQTRFKVLGVDVGPDAGQHTVYLAELPDPRLAPRR